MTHLGIGNDHMRAMPARSVTIRLDPTRLWGWHRALASHLRSCGHAVWIEFKPSRTGLPSVVRRVLALEARTGGGHAALEPLAAEDFADSSAMPAKMAVPDNPAGSEGSNPDPTGGVVIDLSAHAVAEAARHILVPLFDARPGETALWAAILSGRAPHLALFDCATGQPLSIGHPALEAPHSASISAAGILVRLIEGIGLALDGRLTPLDSAAALPAGPVSGLAGYAAGFVARKVAAKLTRSRQKMLGVEPRWAVAWTVQPPGHARLDHAFDPRALYLMPDDGQRYYADPFLFAHGGSAYCFVEELPDATGRGIISVTVLSPDGTAPTPRPVLETGYHLSYPQVFARDGAIHMLPEQHQSGALVLYRCTRFPDRWEPVARLIDEPLHDATLFERSGTLWIAATAQGPAGMRWGSSWDALSLWSSKSLLGPWKPHPGNPVLIDAATARPAGDMFEIEGELYRPTQDCASGYGSAINLARVDRLDAGGFTQAIIGRERFLTRTGLAGPHSLSRIATPAGRFEAIDVFATRGRLLRQGWGTRLDL